nr:hypothetical protein [Tanacetum cinerariifolium]
GARRAHGAGAGGERGAVHPALPEKPRRRPPREQRPLQRWGGGGPGAGAAAARPRALPGAASLPLRPGPRGHPRHGLAHRRHGLRNDAFGLRASAHRARHRAAGGRVAARAA